MHSAGAGRTLDLCFGGTGNGGTTGILSGIRSPRWRYQVYSPHKARSYAIRRLSASQITRKTVIFLSGMKFRIGRTVLSLRDCRDLVKELIWSKLRPSLRLRVMQAPAPVVAVHIRLGDFRELKPGEEFRKVGSTRTPLDYFISTIEQIRVCHGADLPVTVFTDGYPSEIRSVLNLPAVLLATQSTPIVDLLLMSRAGLIVTSAGSTFGYWAGFLADAPVILHPDHIHAPHRPKWINERYFEGPAVGPCETWPDLLVRNIRDLPIFAYMAGCGLNRP